ncbi:MAG: hypothetical protein LBD04_02975 [Synergistaceae bacterium]|jgi:hypothetical protein|nr:hypothetical protein [Synergistaceae bacterium]
MKRTEYHCQSCGRAIYFDGLCYNCRQRQSRERAQAWSDVEVARKMRAIIAALDDKFYKKEENREFFELLAYKDISTEKIAEAATRVGVYYPSELYRDAPPKAREKLLALLETPECKEASHILLCLALAGGEDVLATFARLERNPLPWVKKLHVPLSVYAQAGGWTFDKAGNHIQLNFDKCYPVFSASPDNSDAAVSVAVPREETCPHCGTRLVDILMLDGKDRRLAFLNLPGTVRVPCCPQCSCEGFIVRYQLDGDSAMELVNPFGDGEKMRDNVYAEMVTKKFALSTRPESLFFARGNDEDVITVGGFANWIQDFQYEPCPDCGKTMRYFASVPWAALMDSAEGALYLEICPDCQIIGAFHQQT